MGRKSKREKEKKEHSSSREQRASSFQPHFVGAWCGTKRGPDFPIPNKTKNFTDPNLRPHDRQSIILEFDGSLRISKQILFSSNIVPGQNEHNNNHRRRACCHHGWERVYSLPWCRHIPRQIHSSRIARSISACRWWAWGIRWGAGALDGRSLYCNRQWWQANW